MNEPPERVKIGDKVHIWIASSYAPATVVGSRVVTERPSMQQVRVYQVRTKSGAELETNGNSLRELVERRKS